MGTKSTTLDEIARVLVSLQIGVLNHRGLERCIFDVVKEQVPKL